MPGLDKTGPLGKGSRTGKGMGNCVTQSSSINKNNEIQDIENPKNLKRRMRMGRQGGVGIGNRHRYRGGQDY
jgi:hypothetical protein